MDGEDEYLKDKARMLLQREREYFELLQKQERLMAWFNLGQVLPELFLDRKGTALQRWDRIRKLLISRLRVQRVLVSELISDEMRPLSPAGASVPIMLEVRALFDLSRFGVCNDPAEEVDRACAGLAQTLGLSRFMWSRIANGQGSEILVVAGFDAAKASFQSPFADNDANFFRNATQHVESLLANALLVADVERANEFLEQRVRERTQELGERNRELRLVLDNVDQALITINLEGRLVGAQSTVVDRWFGGRTADPLFLDYVPADQRFASLFKLGLEALRDDILPRELCLDQLPKRLVARGKYFESRYLPIEEGDELKGLLLVIDDVTERRVRAQAEAEQRELLAAFTALMRDRNGFLSFVEQTGRMLEQVSDPACPELLLRQLLHTFKGNAATFGLQVIADSCHAAESELLECGSLRRESIAELEARWVAVLGTVGSVAPMSLHRTIEVSERQLLSFIEQAQQGASATDLVTELRHLQWEPVERSLERLGQQAQALAARLGKPPVHVEISADSLRLEPAPWAEFWSALVHVVRNAIDHGIESGEERAAAGKPRSGRLRLVARRTGTGCEFELADDGRGVDWDRVRRACEEENRPCQSRADLSAALFAPGFSTRSAVSETSGRGIGLSAVATVALGLGGRLEIESEQGRGTRLLLSFPDALPQQ